MHNLSVIQPGLQTTIQDLGRVSHQIDGFPVSGSMDQASHRLANLLVGNRGKTACLEFALTGPTLIFRVATFITITGGQFSPTLNGKPIPENEAIRVHENDELAIGSANAGRYGYLAIKGSGAGSDGQPLNDATNWHRRLQWSSSPSRWSVADLTPGNAPKFWPSPS